MCLNIAYVNSLKMVCSFGYSSETIGVGRFRILGAKVKNIGGGPRGGQIPSRHMTSY